MLSTAFFWARLRTERADLAICDATRAETLKNPNPLDDSHPDGLCVGSGPARSPAFAISGFATTSPSVVRASCFPYRTHEGPLRGSLLASQHTARLGSIYVFCLFNDFAAIPSGTPGPSRHGPVTSDAMNPRSIRSLLNRLDLAARPAVDHLNDLRLSGKVLRVASLGPTVNVIENLDRRRRACVVLSTDHGTPLCRS